MKGGETKEGARVLQILDKVSSSAIYLIGYT